MEYFCSDATIAWLDREVLPLAHKHLKLLDLDEQPGAYGILRRLGRRLDVHVYGATDAVIFGRVLCQSGVFALEGP